jgi:hypothetical protein
VRSPPRASLLALAALAACAKRPAPASPPAAPASGASAAIAPVPPGSKPTLHYRVTPSRLFPEIIGPRGLVATEDGVRRFLVDRMRLVVRADGSMERAAQLLPGGNVQSIALPSRLGGGYLFHVNAGGGTEIWRAKGWLDKLEPLARRGEVISEIVPGFDRLYLKLASGNRVAAIDAQTGAAMGLGPLPVASSYGALAFADGWRAVVDTDLRGPLTTFDAGATWRAVGLQERAQGVAVIDGNPAILVNSGRYLIDPRGGVTLRTGSMGESSSGRDADPRSARTGPLGKRPLRAAVEDGWPDTDESAVVARAGAVARVSLKDGSVLAIAEDAFPEGRASCHAARLGLHGVGFLCGEREGPTVVYEWAPPLGVKQVLRFDKPRVVAASGNGALVIRGRCTDTDAADEPDARWYCVRAPAGDLREIRVKGYDLGVERVVGLGDGRIAVLVPPRGGSPGALSIIAGATTTSVALTLPTEPRGSAREIKRGMWLDGFEERAPGVLGGWVESGGPFVGVEITLDGKVKAGELHEELGGAIFGGRFAVALGDGGHGFETSDGGMTWAPFDMPDRDEEARAAPSRGCGPAGCALPGWVRVGWGAPATPDDMKQAESPTSPYTPIKVSPTLHFDCEVASVSTPPLPDKPKPAAPVAVVRGPRPHLGGGVVGPHGAARDLPTGWLRFRNVEPPALAPDDYAVDNGSPNDLVRMRAYAWGKRGSDWTRNGRWLVRFDDRFDAGGGVRTSALTASLWARDTDALEGIGTGSYGGNQWGAILDPSGKSLLASACRGSGATCSLYSVGEGQPVTPIRNAGNAGSTFVRPYANGAVRVGETWFFLTQSPSYDGVTLWRADLGVARVIGSYHRPSQRYGYEPPRLVRRALGGGIGLVIAGAPEPGERSGSFYVLPVDPETGVIGEAAALARRDFASVPLPRCAPEQDGWVLDVEPDTTTNVEIANARSSLEKVELRVRLDVGRACLEALSAKSGQLYAMVASGVAPGAAKGAPVQPLTAPPGRKGSGDEGAVPLAVTEKLTDRRWGLVCKTRKR